MLAGGWSTTTTTTGGHMPESITIDCDDCVMRGTVACQDCVVTFVCRPTGHGRVVLDAAEALAVGRLSAAGLVPGLRHRRMR
jgi:hypothetical protein